MSVLQRTALFSNERFDLPDARMLEAAVLNDFRFLLSGGFSATSLILRGFEIPNYSTIFTVPGFKLKLSDVVVFHTEASSQAAGFYVSAGTESDFSVTLSPSATNFVELDFDVEAAVSDVRAFWDQGADSGAGGEFSDTVSTVTNLTLSVTANVSGFTTGKLPLYKVVTNSSGVATSLTDCRKLMFRLGTGGSSPDPAHNFGWPNLPDSAHSRLETPVTATSATASNAPNQGGDKNIRDFKAWMDAVMSSIKEIKGTPYWYMPGSAAGGVPGAYQNAALILLTGGTWDHLSASAGHLHLIAGSFARRFGFSNDLTLSSFPSIDLTTNKVLYLLLPTADVAVTYGMGQDAASPIVPKNVTSITPTSVSVTTGGNYLTGGGTILVHGATFSYSSYTAGTGLFSGVTPDPSGLVQVGDFAYQLDSSGTGYLHTSISSQVPKVSSGASFGAERVFWLAYYDGSKIFVKSADLEVGEQVQVSDTTPIELLAYVGSPGEAEANPDYMDALGAPVSNRVVSDGDNLTKGIKKLDQAIAAIQDDTAKEEEFLVTNPAGQTIFTAGTLTWSASSAVPDISVFLNGRKMRQSPSGLLDRDFRKIGTNQVEFAFTVPKDAYVLIRDERTGGIGTTIAIVENIQKSVKNMTGSTIPAFSALTWTAGGTVALAEADVIADTEFAGINLADIPNGSFGAAVKVGNVAGAITGLGATPGQEIYLSDTPGALTTTPPVGPSDSVIIVGIAEPASGVASATTTDLFIQFQILSTP